MAQNRLSNLASIVVVISAVVLTALVVRRELFGTPEAGGRGTVGEWASFASEGHRSGPADAPVTVVVFSDFQCPACRVLAQSLEILRERHPNRFAVVYRHFPLPNHPHAAIAAQASECAGEQGRFAAFHDALFLTQDSIGKRPWSQYAAEAQVGDSLRFNRCVAQNGPPRSVQKDVDAARQLGVQVTPTILINGKRLDGAPPIFELEQLITAD